MSAELRVVPMPTQESPGGLVEMLERLTADARDGRITGFACAFTRLHSETGCGVSVNEGTPILALIGELYVQAHSLIARRVGMPR